MNFRSQGLAFDELHRDVLNRRFPGARNKFTGGGAGIFSFGFGFDNFGLASPTS